MNIEIDIEKNSWINQLPDENKQEIINNYLKLGYITATLTHQTINPLNTLFDPIIHKVEKTSIHNELTLRSIDKSITDNITTLRGTVDNFIYQSANSSLKGKIGEKQIGNILIDHFPDDTIEVTAQQDYESDIQIITSEGINIYVEVKTYKVAVTSSQIDKFKRDLIRSGTRVGIMISTTSGITGKKRLEFEQIDKDQYIIYIPNSGFETTPVIWSVLFAKKLISISSKKKDIDIDVLVDCYKKFESLYKNFSTMKHNLCKTRQTITTSLDELHLESLKINNMIENILRECNEYLYNVLEEKEECIYLNEEIIEFIKELQDNKDKRANSYNILYEYCKKNNYKIYYKNDKFQWMIKNDILQVAETKHTKTRVDLYIPEKGMTLNIKSSTPQILDLILSK